MVQQDRRILVTLLLVVGVLAATTVVRWVLEPFFEPLQAQSIDRLYRLRSRIASLKPTYDGKVILVPIDDRSVAEFEDFYLGRVEHARLVRALGRAGLAAQFHDVVFAAPLDERIDAELARATREAGNVFYGMAVGLSTGGRTPQPTPIDSAGRELLERQRWHPVVVGDVSGIPEATSFFPTFSLLSSAARGMSFLDVVPDRDGVYRRVQLLVRDRDGFQPSLSLLVLAQLLQVDPDQVELRPGYWLKLRDARRPGSEEKEEIAIPIDARGRMLVNYIGPWGSILSYPFVEVVEAAGDRFAMEDLREEVAGRIGIVCWVATGAGDVGSVPTDPVYPKPGIHANTINTILNGEFLREASPTQMLFWVELPLLLLLFLAGLRLSTIPFLAMAVGLVVGYATLVPLVFLYAGWILRVPGPTMQILGSALVVAAYQYHLGSRTRAVLRNTLDAYFAPKVVDKIMGHADDLVEAATKKELSILFSDIKGFTHHSSRLSAARVRDLLNQYFERMIEIVFRHGGTLDKFIGDGLMVFFGDPESQPDHAERSVRAALEMQQAARTLDREWRAHGDMPLEIRVGINSGEVIVGNMGSSRRLSYTVLGSQVNLAQRLESNAPVGGVLISERTYELLGGAVPTRRLEPIVVKGIEEPVAVHEVVLDRDPGSGS
jgi:adenylate cyclase